MAPVARAKYAEGLPEFAILWTRFGLQSHLRSEMLRKLTDSFLSEAAGDAFSWGNGSLFRLCVPELMR
jgi:hypothetical protein